MTTSPAAHTSPLLCPEADKARLEAANGLVVLDYVREKSGVATCILMVMAAKKVPASDPSELSMSVRTVAVVFGDLL